MAHMYPRTLFEPDLKSKAEKKVFDSLERDLDDEWEVFHSAAWIARDKHKGATDGEIDFVIAHAEQGILCLEVKGGGIECQHGEWYGIHDGKRERIRDPFAQATDHAYALDRKLGGMPGKGGKKLILGWGVAFPDISVHQLVLAPDAPPDLILDRNEMKDVASFVVQMIAFHRGTDEAGPGGRGMEKLRNALAPCVRIKVPMVAEFLDEQEQIITLTQNQAELLNGFGRDKRMVITGPAGSGKTVLAVERAKRLARDDKDVLFVCFNRALRDHMRQRERGSEVTFHTFHGLCTHLAKRAEVELPAYEGDPPPDYWNEVLPLALEEAVEELGPQFDAIIVDEAQDLRNEWLDALMTTLRRPGENLVWLFMDDNQRVYEQRLDVPEEFRPFDLVVNCRNTQAIHGEVIKKYEGAVKPEAIGPPGRDVELFQTDDQPQVVRQVVERLCGEEEVPPQDIVVLSSHNVEKSEVARAGCGRFEFTKDPRPVGDYIRFSSIRGFKGLESPVVILCELEDIGGETIDQQLYVGFSRARNHCVVVAPS